jgi:hypothetical protein
MIYKTFFKKWKPGWKYNTEIILKILKFDLLNVILTKLSYFNRLEVINL